MKDKHILLAIFMVATTTTRLLATSILLQQPEVVVKRSPLIIEVVVKEITFNSIPSVSIGEAWITLRVIKRIVGDCPSEILIRRGHVTPNLVFLETEWDPSYTIGEHFMICLLPTSTGYSTMGLYNGKFSIEEGYVKGTRISVDEFVRQIHEIRSGQRSEFPNELRRQTVEGVTSKLGMLGKQSSAMSAGSHLNGEFITWDFTWNTSYVPVQMHYNLANAPSNAPYWGFIAGLAATAYGLWADTYSFLTIQNGIPFTTSAGRADDDFSVILWYDLGNTNWLAETHTYPNDLWNKIYYGPNSNLGVDVWFNPVIDGSWYFSQIPPSSRSSDQYDFVEILTHELGHGIGLRHVSNASSIMYPAYLKGSVPVRNQSDGDLAGRVYQHPLSNIALSGTIPHSIVLSALSGRSVSANGDVIVPSGKSMQLDANASSVTSSGNYKLRVEGNLVADGATFTRSGGQWYGIEFYNGSSGSSLYNCTVQNALYGVFIYNTAVPVSHCTFQNNSTGVYASCYELAMVWNVIEDDYYGVYCANYGDPGLVPNNVIRWDSWGVRGDGTSQPYLGIYMGYNSLYSNDYYDVYSDYSGTIWAQGNWWGDYPAYPIVTGNVDYSGALSVDPNGGRGKRAKPSVSAAAGAFSEVGDGRDTIGVRELDAAYALMLKGQEEEALVAFQQLSSRYSDHFAGSKALVFSSRLQEKRGVDTKSELIAFNSQHPNTPAAWTAQHLLVGRLLKDGAVEEAALAAEHLIGVADSTTAKLALYDAGNISWYRLDDKDRAFRHFAALKERFPGDPLTMSAMATLGENVAEPSRQKVQATLPVTREYALLPSYPNPFNPATRIEFALPRGGVVSLVVYDVLGREVATLADGYYDAGNHSVLWDVKSNASGTYYARFKVFDELGNVKYSRVNKLLLMR